MKSSENKVPCQRRLNGNLRGLKVACLADHNAVRVLAQKRAQNARKAQADGFVHRHLYNPFQIVFDGLFCREELRIDRIDFAQAGVKRCRLSRAGRSGGNEDAIRMLDHLQQKIVDVIGHPECFEVEIHDAAVENPQHQALAELSWQG
jgi:hypothetical protein